MTRLAASLILWLMMRKVEILQFSQGKKNLFKFIELITPVNFSLIPFLYVKDNPLLVVTSEGHVRWIPPLVVKYI